MAKRLRGGVVVVGALALGVAVVGTNPARGETRPEGTVPQMKIKGSAQTYYLSEKNSFFGQISSDFLETAVRVGADVKWSDQLNMDVQLLAENAAGDAIDYTGVIKHDVKLVPELAKVSGVKTGSNPG